MDERKGEYTPAQFGAFLKVQLMAGRQTDRGWFRSAAALRAMLPSAYVRHVDFLLSEGDLVERDGRLYVDGWQEWQEGDLTVGDRMAALRNRRRNSTVTPTVTSTVTEPSPSAIRSSVGVSVGVSSSAEDARDDPEGDAITWLARHGCALPPHSGYYRHVVLMVENHGTVAVLAMLEKLARAGTKHGDVKGFVFGARDALDAKTRPDLRTLDKDERQAERESASRNRVEATQKYLKELRGDTA